MATGSYTKDGRPVIAHNNWTGYLDGERWTIIFDIVPQQGHRFLMDGYPGLIHSADDFGINDAGIDDYGDHDQRFLGMGFERDAGVCASAAGAMQYATTIDEFRGDHEGRQQRRVRERLADRGREEQRDRAAWN